MRCTLCVLLLAGAAHAQPLVQSVARSGQQPIGMPAGTLPWSEFTAPSINDRGDVLFGARCGNPPFTGTYGRWILTDGEVWLSHYSTMPAPQVPGSQLAFDLSIETAVLAGNGEVAFLSAMTPSGEDSVAIFAGSTGNNHLIAKRGQPLPGAAGINFQNMEVPRFNQNGTGVFTSTLSTNGSGLFYGPSSGVTTAIKTGDPAPGLAGQGFQGFGWADINDSGQVAFKATLQRLPTQNVDPGSIWVGTPTAPQLLARTSTTAPGTSVQFDPLFSSSFRAPRINNAGTVAFNAYLTGPANLNTGMFIGTPGSLNLLVRRGDPVSALSGDATLVGFADPALNDSGIVAFTGTSLSPTTGQRSGIWAGTRGALRPFALQGTQAPGMPSGVTFAEFSNPLINSSADVAFYATLSNNARSVWFVDSMGAPQLLAAGGRPLTLEPGDTRTVAYIMPLAGTLGEGSASAFNNHGELAVSVSFTDGSWRVLVLAVPTPGSALPLLAAASFASRRRRHVRHS